MSNVQAIAAITLLLDDEDEEKENVQERSQWVRPWIARIKSDGAYYPIFQELEQEDVEGFRGYVRLNTTSFQKLVELLAPSLLKKDTVMRECIKPEEMCCVALRYFASGESFCLLEYQFRISRKALSYIVEQVAAAMIKILGETCLKTLNTTDEWAKISQKFKELWNFPNGLGGVDGNHIVLQHPKRIVNMNSCLLILG